MSRGAHLTAAVALMLAAALPLSPARGDSREAAPLRGQRQAVLARIDSLWEANTGLASRDLIARHIVDARAGIDSLFLLNLLCREGRLLAALNRAVEAEPILHEGMQLARALHEPLLYRDCLRWLGVALIARGLLPEVNTTYEELLRLSRESGDRYHEGYAWMGLGYCDWQNDRPEEARRKYVRSVDIFRELGQARGELWALIGLNNALTMLGSYEEARTGHLRIVDLGRSSGSREIEALGHNNLGVLLFSLGDMGESLAHFRRAAELQEQLGNLRESIISGMNACICEIMLGRTRKASEELRSFLETSRANGYLDVHARLLTELGVAHLQRGDSRQAARLFREALNQPEGTNPEHLCETLIGLSQALAGMDSTASALRLLRSRAASMLELDDPRLQFAFRNEMAERLLDERLSGEAFDMAMVVEERGARLGLTRLRLEALPLAARAALECGGPDSALALLKRGLRLWEADRGVPLDPEWREQRGAAAEKLFAELTRLILRHPPEKPREERVREAFDALQRYKARTLLERMTGPGGKETAAPETSPATLEQLQTHVLQPGELLLDFMMGEEQSLLFACTSRECRVGELPGEADLSDKIHLFHELLASRPSGTASGSTIESIEITGRSLAEQLFSSCGDLIVGSRHIIVAPDGALNLLPFSYLFRMCGREPSEHGTTNQSSSSAGAPRTESRIPAATVLAWQRHGAATAKERSDLPARILALAGLRTDRGENLRGAKKETGFLARRYAGVATHFEARALADFDILHFAAHSTVDDQSPWRSAIHLADTSEQDHGILRASEIAGWRLPARLAVLSSCESAGGRALSGEGMLGLTSAFLSAGVPSVVATLWPVDDEVTVGFMTAFYKALEEGDDVSTSLLRAQDALRGRRRTTHPFYWAGFVLAGDGEMSVNLRANPHPERLWWTLALLPVIMWLVRRGRKKKMSRAPVIYYR